MNHSLDSRQTDKIPSIENLRVFLAALVVLHHIACTYAIRGLWYFYEAPGHYLYSGMLIIFVAVNQSFFMGLFFLISAYFTPKSYEAKGAGKYLKDRALRLGLPLLCYFFILSPIICWTVNLFIYHRNVSFWNYWLTTNGFGFGPLWFVEALLFFSFIYVCVRLCFGKQKQGSQLPDKIESRQVVKSTAVRKKRIPTPNDRTVLFIAVLTGTLTAIVRIWFPFGRLLEPFGFQVSHFTQYTVLIIIGIIAYRNQWFLSIPLKRGMRWFLFALFTMVFGAPSLLYFGGAKSGTLYPYFGGWHWQSFGYALWEQLLGFSLIMGLLAIFSRWLHRQPAFFKALSDSTYAVYVTHAPIVVGLCIWLYAMPWEPFFKFLFLMPLSLVICFSTAWLLRKLPIVRRVV